MAGDKERMGNGKSEREREKERKRERNHKIMKPETIIYKQKTGKIKKNA